jgi:5-methyltetrahydropteroyltriglutamate--homocysteine methyltransferase
MFETTLAGSLPKPSWLATPNVLWAPWTLTGQPLQEGKEDATALSIRRQEDAGIDIVSDGEQARQHFVHGFLAEVDGVDFDRKVRMGIRNNRYEADCPTVTPRSGGAGSCTRRRRALPAPRPRASSSSPCPAR